MNGRQRCPQGAEIASQSTRTQAPSLPKDLKNISQEPKSYMRHVKRLCYPAREARRRSKSFELPERKTSRCADVAPSVLDVCSFDFSKQVGYEKKQFGHLNVPQTEDSPNGTVSSRLLDLQMSRRVFDPDRDRRFPILVLLKKLSILNISRTAVRS